MFLLFQKPLISQTDQIASLPKQDKITPPQLISLRQAEQLRKNFVSEFPGSYQAYKNIQMTMYDILCSTPSYHPKFTFRSFGRRDPQSVILTANYSLPISCEIDLIFSRYLFSINKSHECIPLLGPLRETILINITNPKYDPQIEKLLDKCLQKYTEGYLELQELQKNAASYLFNLGKMGLQNELELVPQFFVSYKALYEIMCNVLYLEKLKLYKDYIKIQQLSYSSFKKLEAILQDLLKIKDTLNPRILSYNLLGILYFRCYCNIALIHQYEQQIKKMEYGQKNFTLVATEILSLSDDIVSVQKNDIYRTKIDEDFYDFFTEVYQKLFLKTAQRYLFTQIIINLNSSINIYRGVVKEKIKIPEIDELLTCQPLNYFDTNVQNINVQ